MKPQRFTRKLELLSEHIVTSSPSSATKNRNVRRAKAMTTSDTLAYKYTNFGDAIKDNLYGLTMATEKQRREQVERHYPDIEWNDDESILWNWIHAVALDNGVEHDVAKQAIADAADPIFGINKPALHSWLWFLA